MAFEVKMKTVMGIIFFVIILVVGASAQTEILGTSCEPYGSVSIHNEPAADNLPVVAYIDGMEMARSQTLGGQYQLTIIKDNPDTPQKEGWAVGDVVIVKVNGSQANPSLAAAPGRSRVDLMISVLSVRMDTWGKIKALFK
jgi:hypothetical protein